jgi:hypothetical protein
MCIHTHMLCIHTHTHMHVYVRILINKCQGNVMPLAEHSAPYIHAARYLHSYTVPYGSTSTCSRLRRIAASATCRPAQQPAATAIPAVTVSGMPAASPAQPWRPRPWPHRRSCRPPMPHSHWRQRGQHRRASARARRWPHGAGPGSSGRRRRTGRHFENESTTSRWGHGWACSSGTWKAQRGCVGGLEQDKEHEPLELRSKRQGKHTS